MEQFYTFRGLRASIATVIVLLVTAFSGYSQLSGTSYTVNPSGTATSLNYLTISDVCTDLSYGYRSDGGPANGSGSSGNVTIKIYDGTYNESPYLSYVSGSSGGGTITFQSKSGDSSKVIIIAQTYYNYYGGVFTLYACDNITLKQLTITQDASYSYEGNCLYYDGGTNTCTVSGCYLKACPMSSSYWGGALYAPFWSSYMPANDNTFNNNLITGGYYGLYFEGYPWYWAGVGTYSGDIITNNIIDSVGQYGLYCIGGGDNNVISGNKIDMTSSNNQAGIFMEECPATSGSEFKVFNNFITVRGGSGYGLFTDYDMDNCWFMYNNINVTSGSDAAHFDYDYTSSCTVENNNFVNSGGGYAYFVSYSWGNPIGTSDYNNMYTTGSYVASMDYSGLVALSDWQSYTGWDANSVSTDPGYNTSTDLHTTGAGIDGKATPISGITTDIDGATRNSSTPDIGADEFTPVNDDAGITAVTNPTGNYCPGTQTIMATLKDAGVHTLTSCLLTYKVNGTTIGTYTWGGSLTTGSSASVPVGTYSFTSGTYSVDVISSKPNGVTDLNPVNDQASVSGLHQGMSGTKTIALTGSPDYSSFTAAINDLKLGGLCGAVVFNVGNGSYNENPSFGQQVISNASSTNTITFQSASGDSSKAIVDASFTYNYYSALFDLTNTSWVILNKLTIRGINTSGQYGHGLWISGSNHCTVQNCIIQGNGINATNQYNYSYAIYNDVYNGTGYVNCNNFTLNNCRLSGFYYGIYEYGYNYSTGVENVDNSYKNSVLDSTFYYGFMFQQTHHPVIDGCTETNLFYPYGYAYSFYVSNCDSIRIVNNKINPGQTTYYGALTLQYNSNSSSYHGLVANNFVTSKGSSSYYGNGIYMQGNYYTDVVYNSVNVTNSSSSYALYNGYNSYNYNSLYNNNFVNSAGGWAAYAYSSYYSNGHDYNNFWTTGSTGTSFINWDGTTYTNASASFSSFASSYGSHSVMADPLYNSSSDLHAVSGAINAKATPIAAVTKDIDGQTRNSSTPDIGADEFTPVNDDAGVTSITNPSGAFCSGTTSMTCNIKNYGLNSLSSAVIHYSINSGATTGTYTWTGTAVATGGSITGINFGNYSFTGSTNSIVVYVTDPNGNLDGNNANDTSKQLNMLAGVGGSKTIKTSGGDYTSFSAAVSAIQTNGLCGSVVITADNGTWSDQLSIPSSFPATASKTVTFQGNTSDSSKVVFNHPMDYSYSTNYAIQLNGCQYVTFKKMTISRSNGSYGYNMTINFQNGASNNTFQGCDIKGNYGYGYNNVNDNSSSDTANKFISTRIAGNQYTNGAVYLQYSKSWLFQNCVFDSGYYNNLYAYNTTDLNVKNCLFQHQVYTYPYSYGYADLYMSNCGNAHSPANGIIGNTFLSTNMGVYDNGYSGTNTYSMLIANNFFVNNVNNSYYGYNVGYWGNTVIKRNIVYNSFNATTSGSSYGNMYLYDYSYYGSGLYAATITVKNNCFSNTGGGYNVYYTNYWGGYATFNYNNYYYSGSYAGYHSAYGAGSFATWQGWGQDPNGKNSNPLYTSATNLHAYGAGLNGNASPGYVTTDIDGDTRNSSTPDIGADEFTPSPNDGAITAILSPTSGYCAGTATITATLGNYGTNNLSSAVLTWRVTGAATASGTFSWSTGTPLTFGQSVTVAVGTYSFPASGTLNVSVHTNLPNGATDLNTSNDSSYAPGLNPALGGTKTIAKTGSPDYASFGAAVTDIVSKGLCGNLLLQVGDGLYNEQVSLNSSFPASATSTVTFQGNTADSTKVLLDWDVNYSYSSNYALQFNGCKYVTFENLTITRANGGSGGGYNTVVNIQNGSCNNKLQSVRIINGAGYGYNAVQDQNSADTGNTFNKVRFGGSPSGGDAVYLYGVKSMTFSNCIFDSGYYSNLYAQYTVDLNVKNCLFQHQQYVYPYGANYADINLWYCGNSHSPANGIIGNKFISTNIGVMDYYNAFGGTNTYSMLIANNMFINNANNSSSGYNAGYYSYYTMKRNILYNSFSGTTSGSANGLLYINYDYSYYGGAGGSSIVIKNNCISNTGGGYCVYYTNYWGYYATFNYNNYYFTGSYLGYYSPSGTANSFSTWQGYGLDANGKNVNPIYAGLNDLHVYGAGLNGAATPISMVTTDFDLQTRNASTPDIGADEFTPSPNDAAMSAIVNPVGAYCSGTTTMSCTLINAGTNSLSTAVITWRVTGAASASGTYSWSGGPLLTGASVTIPNIGTYAFTSGTYNVSIASSLPNGAVDGNMANDSLYESGLLQGVGGTKTISHTGTPDYGSFTAAVAALNTGLCGSVLFQVADGAYNEQVSIGTIPTSPSKTVTFQGNTGDSTKVMLFHACDYSYSTNYVLQLNGAQYVTFENMTLTRDGGNSTYGYNSVVSFRGGASNNTFKSARIMGNSANQGYGYPGAADMSSNDTNETFTAVHFSDNEYGAYGTWGGSSSWSFTRCQFDSCWYYGLMIQNTPNWKIVGNTFKNMRNSGGGNLYMYYATATQYNGSAIVAGNTFICNNADGIMDYYPLFTGTANYNFPIVNNMIVMNGGSYGYHGIYSGQHTFYYNSIEVNSGSGATYPFYMEIDYSTCYGKPAMKVENNIFSNKDGGQAIYYYTYCTNPTFNYNDYYTTGSTLGYLNGSTANTLSDWQGLTGQDANSVSVSPLFGGTNNLHCNSAALNGAGTPISGITTDIDGDTRNASTPDIGADEFTPAANDAGITMIVNPNGVYCASVSTGIKVAISNFGSNALSTCTVNYHVTGAATYAGTYTYSPSTALASGASDTVVIGSYTFVSGTYNLGVTTSLPNGTTDGNLTNDSSYESGMNAGLFGTKTIGTGGGYDYSSFGAAITALSNGVCGAVVFQAADHTYSESIEVPAVLGASSTNTITFRGNVSDSTKVKIKYSTSSTYNSVVRFNGASYVTFDHITIWSNYYMDAVNIMGGSTHNTVTGGQILGYSSNPYYYGVSSYQDKDEYNTFNANYFHNFGYGVYMYGSSGAEKGNSFTNNVIDQVNYDGMHFDWPGQNGITISGNNIVGGTNGGYENGIYLYGPGSGAKGFTISGNYIEMGPHYGGYGIQVNNFYNGTSTPGIIANNMIIINDNYSYGYQSYGLYLGGNDQIYTVYNTISMNSYYAYAIMDYDATGTSPYTDYFINNIVVDNVGSYYPLMYYVYADWGYNYIDYNDYYTVGSYFWYTYSYGYYYAVSDWFSYNSYGWDSHSLNILPSFVSSSDLHISSTNACALKGKGTLLSYVTDDYDHDSRGTMPDIGADQYPGSPNGLWVGGVSTDWLTGSNWCSGSIPTSSDDVAIGTGCSYYPDLSTGTTTPVCKNVDILTGGSLSISGGELTFYGAHLNNAGTWSFTSGDLVSGATTGSVHCQPTTYNNVTSNGAVISLGSATVNGDFILNGGSDSIGAATLTLNGAYTFNSGATIQSDVTSSNIVFNGSGASTTLPACKLNDLTINRASGITMNGNVTVGSDLELTNGALSIGANTLTLNDKIAATSGSLTGGTTSNMDFEGFGSSTWTIPTITGGLGVMRVNRSNGLTLGDDISVNDTLLLLDGTLDMTTNSKSITLPNLSNIVRSNGSMNAAPTISGAGSTINLYYLAAVTTSFELPTTVNNININIASGTVSLASNLTVNGDMSINSGTFGIGANALSLGGNLTVAPTAGISTTSSTDLTIADYTSTAANITLPTMGNLHNLTMNRANGASITGNMNIANILNMTLGNLNTDNTGGGGNIDTIFLASTGSISNESSTSYVVGRIQTSNPVANDGNTYSFGNLGTDITVPTTASNPGGIVVTRSVGLNASGAGSNILEHNGNRTGRVSAYREYHIVPTNNGGLNAALVLHYLDAELNGVPESGIDIYRMPEGGSVFFWAPAGTRNTTSNTIALRSGTDSFSTWTIGGTATPLPVEMTTFTAQLQDETSAKLNWITASEINNDHFDIERSEDGRTFAKVGEKAGHGTTQDINKYDYVDRFGPSVMSPVLYYRLKQVDYNGAFTYSEVRKVVLTAKTEGVKVWYNRDIEKLQGTITVNNDRQVAVKVIDVQGKPVAEQSIHVTKGNNAIELDMQGFAQGVYTFIYSSDEGVQTKKFIKY